VEVAWNDLKSLRLNKEVEVIKWRLSKNNETNTAQLDLIVKEKKLRLFGHNRQPGRWREN